jgi:hypothetical protein
VARCEKRAKTKRKAVETATVLLFLELALAGDAERPVLHLDFDILSFHLRQFSLDGVFLVIFLDVHEWAPLVCVHRLIGIPSQWRSREDAVHTVRHSFKFP